MRSKISLKRSLSIMSIGGIASFSIVVFFMTLDLLGRGSYTEAASLVDVQVQSKLIDVKPVEFIQGIVTSEPASSGSPASPAGGSIRLKIPKINVDAAVEDVGLTPDGAMGVPKGPSDVAWFELGPRPGDNGSAVIAGHYGRWKNGEGSVFDDLNKLSEGDRLYVEDDQGVVATFVVRASRIYDPKADAQDVFSSNDGGSHLNLIACDGVWDKVSKSYSERLVIFTDKE